MLVQSVLEGGFRLLDKLPKQAGTSANSSAGSNNAATTKKKRGGSSSSISSLCFGMAGSATITCTLLVDR
jgi:hypothetical protein